MLRSRAFGRHLNYVGTAADLLLGGAACLEMGHWGMTRKGPAPPWLLPSLSYLAAIPWVVSLPCLSPAVLPWSHANHGVYHEPKYTFLSPSFGCQVSSGLSNGKVTKADIGNESGVFL